MTAASKFAVKGYIDSLRLELLLEDAPVSVTLIQPNGINSPFGAHAMSQMDARSMVPPPVHAPEVVAKTICRAPSTRRVTSSWAPPAGR